VRYPKILEDIDIYTTDHMSDINSILVLDLFLVLARYVSNVTYTCMKSV